MGWGVLPVTFPCRVLLRAPCPLTWRPADPGLPLSRQLTTVAEKSRVLQLEEELSLRREEIVELQQCLLHSGPPPADHPEAAETLRLRERLRVQQQQ